MVHATVGIRAGGRGGAADSQDRMDHPEDIVIAKG
jgi:hypothetical protein